MRLDIDSKAFCHLMTESCILLFFRVSNSKLVLLLIMNYSPEIGKSNKIQTNFDSNGTIATFDHEPSAPKNKLSQTEACCHFAPPKQTESKGNFCLITVYSHKNVLQPQNIYAKKQTLSNRFTLLLCFSASLLLCFSALGFALR
jgi:hypothetical protein